MESGRRPLFVWVVGLVVILDQVVKALVRPRLDLHDSITVIPGLFSLTRVHNTGAAFGLMNSIDFPFKAAVLALLQTAALIGLTVYVAMLAPHQRLTRLGLSFVIGGAIGNLIDRLRFGAVVDFLDVYWRGWHWPAFNVADSAISIGVVLLALQMILADRAASRA